ncbi:hypothetical protein [Aquimarina aggregata]|uniref:hypothetical protein n=1 Tax=Aquimarina aggregata TaxID=1642818 RepID=UPI002491C573|nr:hypothetical protein [Aquimarina aggregata]
MYCKYDGYSKVTNTEVLAINYYDHNFDLVGLENPGTVSGKALKTVQGLFLKIWV